MIAVLVWGIVALCGLSTNAQALEFQPVTACRLADTRLIGVGNALPINIEKHFSARGVSAPLQGGSKGCMAPDEAEVIAINVVVIPATGASTNGFLEIYPWQARPDPPTSRLNYGTTNPIANEIDLELAPISLAGFEFSIRPNNATAHVVIDLVGYYFAE